MLRYQEVSWLIHKVQFGKKTHETDRERFSFSADGMKMIVQFYDLFSSVF